MIEVLEVPISEIEVGPRKRQLHDQEKIMQMAQSILQIGLLKPILITEEKKLIAGLHRLESFRFIGRATIPAIIMQGSDLDARLAEIDENLIRNELTALEVGEHLLERDEILTARGERAQSSPGTNQYTKVVGENNSPTKTTSDIASEVGLSERVAQQRKQAARDIAPEVKDVIRHTEMADSPSDLLKLAQMQPEKQAKVASLIASGEASNLRDAQRCITYDHVHEMTLAESLTGRYSVIYADPPWNYGNAGLDDYGHAERHYKTMLTDDICGLPVKEFTTSNAVLFMWATSPLLEDAMRVIKAWGFEYKTSFVWDKVRHNFGHYNSVRHEFLLLAVRGSYTPESKELHDSVIELERTERHSEKPEYFRRLIEKMYPSGSKLELFARSEHDNWTAWGNEVGGTNGGL